MSAEVETHQLSTLVKAPEKERRQFPRFEFSGLMSLWAGGKLLEVRLLDVSQAAALVEAPVTFIRLVNRLVGAHCFSSSTFAYPIGSLRKDIDRIEIRTHSARTCRLVIHFSMD